MVPATNGITAAPNEAPKSTTTPAPYSQPPGSKPSTGIFITSGADSEEECKALFTEAEQAKIKSISKFGKYHNNFIVQFNTVEDCTAALDRVKAQSSKDGKRVNAKYFEDRASKFPPRESQGGAGTWQGSQRGGAQGAASTRGGYQSTGGATTGSDSEGGRGRGGFRGRGGRGRGDDDRGRGRGGRGRGGFNKTTDGVADAKPAASEAKSVANASADT